MKKFFKKIKESCYNLIGDMLEDEYINMNMKQKWLNKMK